MLVMMLDYAHQRAIEALRGFRAAVFVTSGPAGVLANEFPCEANGMILYLLVPQTSDHLFNLEHDPKVTLLSDGWELKGAAQIVSPVPAELELALMRTAEAKWCALVRVDPRQMQIRKEIGWGNYETFDLKITP